MEAVRVVEIEVLGLLKQFLECGNKPFEESKVKDHMKAHVNSNQQAHLLWNITKRSTIKLGIRTRNLSVAYVTKF